MGAGGSGSAVNGYSMITDVLTVNLKKEFEMTRLLTTLVLLCFSVGANAQLAETVTPGPAVKNCDATSYSLEVPPDWFLILPLENTGCFLERYIVSPTIETNENGYINYWIWVNYFDLEISANDLLEVNCEEPLGFRTKYRRKFTGLMGEGDESSYEHITDWLYPPDGTNYAFEISTICDVAQELKL
jgi:hypothetical protein